ncbi:MAG: phosphatase PAP2 family protein [Polyangiaceae bacterium]|nr:phosphatase PAP2 family protein [Polyangiaceae bacterium]
MCFLAAILGLSPHVAFAQEEDGSLWRDEWPQFRAIEGFFTTGALLGMLVFMRAGTATEPRWSGGILFDDAARDALRLHTPQARRTAQKVGDVTYFMFPVIPIGVDVLISSLAVRQDTKAALNLTLVSGEAFAYSGFLSFVVNWASARERPEVTGCRESNGGDVSKCNLLSRTESFYSGHTAMAATSAGVVCANHAYMPLWGHPAADAFACALASATAATTGMTRVLGDRHYMSDVILGSVMGFGIGYSVPTLLHYRVPGSVQDMRVVPGVEGSDFGLTVTGQF